ncbi:MAG TPA: aldolase/citrate lyase family protein [Solirubrobacterales bacterium]|nr:aldolase/citrate lyase family protein [Solirubrobacterales bacterium]
MTSDLRSRIRSVEPTVGTFLNLGSPLAAEVCALAGFDWLLVDLEHGGGGEDSLLGPMLAAAAHRVPVIVRVESSERIRSGRVLDLGAAGVMFPRLDTAEQVREASLHLRYPPQGDRGVATYNRACGFGLRADALQRANEEIVGIVQIETAAALEEVEAIAQISGVDALFVGPADLSHALGVPGRLDAPEFCAALERVVATARAAGIGVGMLARDRDSAQRYVDDGFTFMAIGSDSTLLAAAAGSVAKPLGAATGVEGL